MFSCLRDGLSNDDVGVSRNTPYFRRYGRERVSKPVISLKKSWGGTGGGGYRRTTRS